MDIEFAYANSCELDDYICYQHIFLDSSGLTIIEDVKSVSDVRCDYTDIYFQWKLEDDKLIMIYKPNVIQPFDVLRVNDISDHTKSVVVRYIRLGKLSRIKRDLVRDGIPESDVNDLMEIMNDHKVI